MDQRDKLKYPEAGDGARGGPNISLRGRRKRREPRRGPDGSYDPGTDSMPRRSDRSGRAAELETYERPSNRAGVESVRND